MVDVKASNLKLKQRSRNIIRSIDSSSKLMADQQLDTLIGECGGSIKLALMTLLSGLTISDSSDRLQAAGGVLKIALETWECDGRVQTPDSSTELEDNTNSEQLALCIDGGGSKCAVAVGDASGHIGRAEGGPCNL